MDKSKMMVRIAGHEYSMSTDDPDHVQRVARYIDRRMSDLAAASRLPAPMVTMMTAMNIADEMLRAQDENARLRQELTRLTKLAKAAPPALPPDAADADTDAPY